MLSASLNKTFPYFLPDSNSDSDIENTSEIDNDSEKNKKHLFSANN